jgi:hypothetical protein
VTRPPLRAPRSWRSPRIVRRVGVVILLMSVVPGLVGAIQRYRRARATADAPAIAVRVPAAAATPDAGPSPVKPATRSAPAD